LSIVGDLLGDINGLSRCISDKNQTARRLAEKVIRLLFRFRFHRFFKMSEPTPHPSPSHPFEKLKEAMKQILTVPKAEIVRREKEDRARRKDARARRDK
jgi:hypothetical protein